MVEYIIDPKLREVSIQVGRYVAERKASLVRGNKPNKEWVQEVEGACEETARRVLQDFAEAEGYQIHLVTMPYTAETVERADGEDSTELLVIGRGKKKAACLYDTIDATWNEAAGIRDTVSSIVAFTGQTTEVPETFSLGDFSFGVVAPHHGEGLYHGARGSKPRFRRYSDGCEEPLRLTQQTDPKRLRCMIDLFTAQDDDTHSRAVNAVVPIIREWNDFGRLYGSGVEFMTLLGRLNTDPAYGGYVGVEQKTDNLIAPLIILEGVGAEISGWNGESVSERELDERVSVVVAANKALHDGLISHLKGIL